MTDLARRRTVSWLLLAAGLVAAVTSLVNGFSQDPNEGEGWVGGVVEAVFMAVPLVAVGIGLRSSRPEVLRRTAIGSSVLAALVGFVLAMQLLDENEVARDRLVSAAGLAAYLVALAVAAPAVAAGRRRAARS